MPNISSKERILKGLYAILRPLVRLLLRAGIGFTEFSELAKCAYVFESSVGYGLRSRATNNSRIAVMTGLSRREIKRIKEQGFDHLKLTQSVATPGATVLTKWHTDKRFLSPDNLPKPLDQSSVKDGFQELVKSCAGDVPPGAVKVELKRMGAVKEGADGKLRVVQRSLIPSGIEDKIALSFESNLKGLLETLDHNCDPGNDEVPYFERAASVKLPNGTDFRKIRGKVNEELEPVAIDIDNFLEDQVDYSSSQAREVGVGFYYFEYPIEESKSSS